MSDGSKERFPLCSPSWWNTMIVFGDMGNMDALPWLVRSGSAIWISTSIAIIVGTALWWMIHRVRQFQPRIEPSKGGGLGAKGAVWAFFQGAVAGAILALFVAWLVGWLLGFAITSEDQRSWHGYRRDVHRGHYDGSAASYWLAGPQSELRTAPYLTEPLSWALQASTATPFHRERALHLIAARAGRKSRVLAILGRAAEALEMVDVVMWIAQLADVIDRPIALPPLESRTTPRVSAISALALLGFHETAAELITTRMMDRSIRDRYSSDLRRRELIILLRAERWDSAASWAKLFVEQRRNRDNRRPDSCFAAAVAVRSGDEGARPELERLAGTKGIDSWCRILAVEVSTGRTRERWLQDAVTSGDRRVARTAALIMAEARPQQARVPWPRERWAGHVLLGQGNPAAEFTGLERSVLTSLREIKSSSPAFLRSRAGLYFAAASFDLAVGDHERARDNILLAEEDLPPEPPPSASGPEREAEDETPIETGSGADDLAGLPSYERERELDIRRQERDRVVALAAAIEIFAGDHQHAREVLSRLEPSGCEAEFLARILGFFEGVSPRSVTPSCTDGRIDRVLGSAWVFGGSGELENLTTLDLGTESSDCRNIPLFAGLFEGEERESLARHLGPSGSGVCRLNTTNGPTLAAWGRDLSLAQTLGDESWTESSRGAYRRHRENHLTREIAVFLHALSSHWDHDPLY